MSELFDGFELDVTKMTKKKGGISTIECDPSGGSYNPSSMCSITENSSKTCIISAVVRYCLVKPTGK